MDKKTLKRYAEVREAIKELEAKEAEIKSEIVEDMQKNKLDKVESDFGMFTLASRKSWKFSDKVVALEEKLKIAKFTEQEKGIAKSSETTYMVYKPIVTE